MIYVLILCGGLWALGAVLGVAPRRRLVVIGLVWVLAFPVLCLPLDAASDDLRVWVLVTLLAVVGVGYALILKQLKSRVKAPVVAVQRTPAFQPEELERYARHIMLREIGGPGQKAMKQARVLVIGAGGLGSPALMYLAAAGVGVIGVVDDDVVDASNLQRQIIHTNARGWHGQGSVGQGGDAGAEPLCRGAAPYQGG